MGYAFTVSTWDKSITLDENGEYVSHTYDFTKRYEGDSFIAALYSMFKYKGKKFPYVKLEWR